MAKTVVIKPADNTGVPFLRGILTRSLQNVGVPFDDAYRLASEVRRELEDVSKITTKDLRTIVLRHLGKKSYVSAAEHYQTNVRVPTAIMVHDEDGDGEAFSRAKMRQRLESCGLSTEDASGITAIVYDRLLQEKRLTISSRQLAALTFEYIQQEIGNDCAHRYLVWLEFSQSGRPLILLIGGTAASGKSTIATEIASQLEIVRTQSTDMLRQVMRMMIPESLLPALHTSSFDAWKTLSNGQKKASSDHLVIDGYLQQANLIEVASRAVIERALQERASLVLEGVHVLPSLRERIPGDTDAVVVPIMLGVLKRDHLMQHIRGRGSTTPKRRSERYMENFEDIWRVQTYILSEADRTHTPIVVSGEKEATIREFLRIIGDTLAQNFDPPTARVLTKMFGPNSQLKLPAGSKRQSSSSKVKTKK